MKEIIGDSTGEGDLGMMVERGNETADIRAFPCLPSQTLPHHTASYSGSITYRHTRRCIRNSVLRSGAIAFGTLIAVSMWCFL